MGGVIDFHTHAFPDALADRAMGQLQARAGIRACLDGRVGSLLASMDRAGIDRSVVCCIATRRGSSIRFCGGALRSRRSGSCRLHRCIRTMKTQRQDSGDSAGGAGRRETAPVLPGFRCG